MTDPIERADELEQRLLVIPEDKVFTKRTVTLTGLVLLVILFVGFGLTYQRQTHILRSTNDAVTQEIPSLKHTIAERDHTIAQQNDVIGQATDGILALQKQVRDLGGTPPDLVIRPKE